MLKQIIKDKFLFRILVVSIAAVLILPAHVVLFTYPAFTKALSEEAEEDALCIATHLMNRGVSMHAGIAAGMAPADFLKEAEGAKNDFRLSKIKVFSPMGEIIYSTDAADLGKINSEPYFREIVAQGGTYTKVVRKNNRSLEGQIVYADLVETYVPIMRDNTFAGAFEIYMDVTNRKTRIDNLISLSHFVMFTTAIGLLSAVIALSLKASHHVARIELAEESLRVANEILACEATTCALTGIGNRRKFNETLNVALARNTRHHTPLSIIMFDIDHFKNINDTYGHKAGDSVLKEIAQLVCGLIRQQDSFARWGGEEFLILAPDIDCNSAVAMAEKLRVAVEEHRFDEVGSIRCSFGVTELIDGDTADTCVKRVDDALYQAKESGRNTVKMC